MGNQQDISQHTPHLGGDTRFWRDSMVDKYEYQQSLLSEKKEEVLRNITRIVNYFCKMYSVDNPTFLDVGCGPGTALTLSNYILQEVPKSILIGVDSSSQMIEAANKNLFPQYGNRFSGYTSNFNTSDFWVSEIDRNYDFIVSSGALHYLSDQRRGTFFKEVHVHLENNGVFIACIANRSIIPEIAEMEHIFRLEYTYNKFEEDKRPQDFEEFRKRFEEEDRKANINWQNPAVWLNTMQRGGFKRVDVVWHLWVRSIFVAVE